MSVGSQFWKQEEKDRLEPYNLHIHHVMIRSEHRYLIGAKNVGTAKWTRRPVPTRKKTPGFGSPRVTNPPSHTGSGFWPGNDYTRTERPAKHPNAGGLPRPIANTNCRKRIKEYQQIPGHNAPHKLRGLTKYLQERMRPRAGKDRVCIAYIEIMSIYPGYSKYILPVTESISIIPVSPNVYI